MPFEDNLPVRNCGKQLLSATDHYVLLNSFLYPRVSVRANYLNEVEFFLFRMHSNSCIIGMKFMIISVVTNTNISLAWKHESDKDN